MIITMALGDKYAEETILADATMLPNFKYFFATVALHSHVV